MEKTKLGQTCSTTCDSVILGKLGEERAQGEELDNTTGSLLESYWWQFQPLELIELTQRYAGGAGLLSRYPSLLHLTKVKYYK